MTKLRALIADLAERGAIDVGNLVAFAIVVLVILFVYFAFISPHVK